MNFLLKLLFVFVGWKFQQIKSEELVGVLVPKVAYNYKHYNSFVKVFEYERKSEVAVQFLNQNITYEIANDGYKTFQFPKRAYGKRLEGDLYMTLYREKFTNGRLTHNCNTQISKVNIDDGMFHAFIQLDKPIYKPGDEIKFRIIVVDKELIPFQMNNLEVIISDPFERTMQIYEDIEDQNNGLYMNTYTLSANTLLGDWKISVTVNKKYHLRISKLIPVQKYVLPEFGVNIETTSKHYLRQSKLVLRFDARYSFGDFVTGNAKLIIDDIDQNKTCYTKEFKNINGVQEVVLNVPQDLGLNIINRVDLKATVFFTEPESDVTANKSTEFSVHNEPQMEIKPIHSKTFMPGLPFNMKVFAKQWNDVKVDTTEPVNVDFKYELMNGTKVKVMNRPNLKDGVATQEVIIPKEAVDFTMECKLGGSKTYRKKLERGQTEHGKNALSLGHRPERPKIESNGAEIFIHSEREIGKIVYAIMTKFGNVKSKVVDCHNEIACGFQIDVTENMTPHFTVEIYHVRNKDIVEHGSIDIKTESLSANHLTMKLSSSTAKTKENITMQFDTLEDSKIYLLAIDKRLRFLKDGNDVTKEDVINELSGYRKDTEMLLDDMTTWHECSAEELHRVRNGRRSLDAQFSDVFKSDDDFVDDGYSADEPTDPIPEPKKPETEDELMREEFPETWLFETIEADSSELSKKYKVPDAITSWHITAFSMHDSGGLAIMNPQELVVKNEFFVKFSLPYSIRFKEILKIDVMVFNYIKTTKPINVKLTIRNKNSKEFQFVEYQKKGSLCEPTYNNDPHKILNVEVPISSVKRVSFYIRSNPKDDNNNVEKRKAIVIYADTVDNNGKKYRDVVGKYLKIEPVGVRKFEIETNNFIVEGKSDNQQTWYNTSQNTNTYCIVSSDYLSDVVNLNSHFQTYGGDCLEQKTSKLKGNVQVYKYYTAKKKTTKKDYFNKQYQEVWARRKERWNYETSTGYIAYFLDAVVPAMELTLITHDKAAIEKELDKLRDAQTAAGNFNNFGKFPDFNRNNRVSTGTYFETAFILVSILKAQNFVTKDYKDVINKAFAYLDADSNKLTVDNEGLSIAAYAYILGAKYNDDRITTAGEMLKKIENYIIKPDTHQKCYRVNLQDTTCNMRHTAYTAMAYLKLKDIDKAMPLVYWLLKNYNFNVYHGYTYNSAILSEPIAEAAVTLNTAATDLKITLKNELHFRELLKFTQATVKNYHEILYPPNSRLVDMTVAGTGFCSITRVTELMIVENLIYERFAVTLKKDINSPRSNEKIIRICAKYDATNSDYLTLVNVIYEVEMPSGYVYNGIVDEKNKMKEIKTVEERHQKTLALVYYNDFEHSKDYCVDLRLLKLFDVKDPKSAAIKIYDFNDKRNVAIEFYEYKPSTSC